MLYLQFSDFYLGQPLQMDGKRIGNLDRWLSDASQPFNMYAHHSSILKVRFEYI